jgi:hypothetical protein
LTYNNTKQRQLTSYCFIQTIVSLPLRKAKELGLETPTLETINALVCALDWRFRNNVAPPAGPLAESQ